MTRLGHSACNRLAAGLGFEPRYPAPEAGVLPLDDPAKVRALLGALSYYPPLSFFSIGYHR